MPFFKTEMQKNRSWRKILLSAALLVITITLWALFAPLQFGGNVAYVIVAGDSMSPKYMLGDLVVIRNQENYKIGDSVTYQHPEIDYVFHRIVEVDPEGRFILQGDHNAWEDSYHPSEEEIVGKLWWHIPKLGNTLESLRSPWGFAILTLVFGFLLFTIVVPPDKKRGRRKERGKGNFMSGSYQKTGENLFILAVLALGALFLGLAAFRHPVLNEIHAPLAYEQQAVFHYTANVPSGIYDSDRIQPGEPIFRLLNGSFSIGLNYLFISVHPAELEGTYRLLARVSDGSGWKRTLELTPETAFSGNVFTVSETLELDEIQGFIDSLEKETGVARSQYTLSVLSEIQIEGRVSELALQDSFSPEINFDITNLEVVLRDVSDLSQDALSSIKTSALTRTLYEQNHLNILGLKIPVLLARWIAAGVGIPAVLFLIFSLVQLYTSTQRSELERVRVWYGSMLIEARDMQILDSPRQVEIASIDDLAKFAEQDQRSILHLPDGNSHHFFVQTPEQLYHYQLEENSTGIGVITAPANKENWVARFPWKHQPSKLQHSYTRALEGWANAVDMRFYEEGHSEEVAKLTEKLAISLGVRGYALEEIRLGAYLHDIGLMNIPDSIVQKKKKLTKKEWDIIRNHPEQAKAHLTETNLQSSIIDVVHYHHERWDGSGYPEGLRGEEIPLGARIVAVIDVWDALKHPRPYRDSWSSEEICQYFREQSGIQFDPRVTEAFLKLLVEEFPEECEEVITLEAEVQDVIKDKEG